MGGGAAMRAAGKLTGMGVFKGGLRGGISAAQPAEQALRNVSHPTAAVVSTATSSVADVAAIQKASWEADWDFAAVEEDLRVESSPEPIARVVFDVPPTLQEAKDATADLKEALDKVYLSSPEYGPSFSLPLFANSDNLETKSCNSCDSNLASVPTPAFNAFKLLSESPAVQSVVASIAADQKVWDAVMENQELKEFMLSQRNNAAVEDQESHRMSDESSTDSSPGDDTAVKFGDAEDGKIGDTEGRVNKFFQKVKKSVFDAKKSVVDMVSNASDIFQKFFVSSPAERTSADDGGAGADAGGARGSFNEKTMGASLMGLAIMVITLVVLKRV